MYPSPYDQSRPDPKRMMLAMALAAMLVIVWQTFIEAPKREQLKVWQAQQATIAKQEVQQIKAETKFDTREEAMNRSPRLKFSTGKLHGSIALKGLRFDDATLIKYRETKEPTSPEVVLLTPSGTGELPYFIQLGWIASNTDITVPNNDSQWQADAKELSPTSPVKLTWKSPEGAIFTVEISVDEAYMFRITQTVENRSAKTTNVAPFSLINRGFIEPNMHGIISHEGPIGVLDETLSEPSYKDLREKAITNDNARGWIGFTDKYWLTALIPDNATTFKANFSHYETGSMNRYQADAAAALKPLATGESLTTTNHMFIGAKEIELLDNYAAGVDALQLPPIPLFDRALDLGMLYFLTKPIFLTLNFFYGLIGNFGVAILGLTLLIKLLMFPLANKGYKAAWQMRKFQPEMVRIKEECGDDRLKFQQAMLAMYKKEKINPASGCLPMLIQIPVFFALYKVLFVTIEMRHAPFFWVWNDLSAADPTNLFTFFGLIPWTPPTLLHLGILPILMTVTMIIQMKQQPTPTDPVQAKVMSLMPYMLLVMVAKMPAGLLIYWVFSNVFSILQQAIITRRLKAQG